MTAHVVYDALDPRRPATLSSRICHDLLRRRLGFRGVLFSDDLEMQAVAGRRTPERSAVAALAAGCDMLLVCQSLDAAVRAMDGVERAVERATLDGPRGHALAAPHPGAAPARRGPARSDTRSAGRRTRGWQRRIVARG